MNSRAEGTETTPLDKWEEGPGKGRDVASCRHHQSALIMCSNGHRVSLAAGQSQHCPWGPAGGLGGSCRPSRLCRRDATSLSPAPLTQTAPRVTYSSESQAQDNLCEGIFSCHEVSGSIEGRFKKKKKILGKNNVLEPKGERVNGK